MGLKTDIKEIRLGDLIFVKGSKRFVKAINIGSGFVLVHWYPGCEPSLSFVLTETHLLSFERSSLEPRPVVSVDTSQLRVDKEYVWVHLSEIHQHNSIRFIINSINKELDT